MSGVQSADRPVPNPESTSGKSDVNFVEQRKPVSKRVSDLINRFTCWVKREKPNPDAALQEIAAFPLENSKQDMSKNENQAQKFKNMCRSKIIGYEGVNKEKRGDFLAHYWSLLCKKFEVPFLQQNISFVRFNAVNILGGAEKTGGYYNPVSREIRFFSNNPNVQNPSRAFAHEIAHAVLLGNYSKLGTPDFIAEGMMQAGESFSWMPDAQKKRTEIAKLPHGDRLKMASEIFQLRQITAEMQTNIVSGLKLPPSLWELHGLHIPSGDDMYSDATGMFFRYLLEEHGAEKLKSLGRNFSLLKGEKQIEAVFQKVYGDNLTTILHKAVSYWCEEDVAGEAFGLMRRFENYSRTLKAKFGNGTELYLGSTAGVDEKALGEQGGFDVLQLDYRDKAGNYNFRGPFLINPTDGTVREVVLPRKGQEGDVKQYPSLAKI